MTSRRFKLLPLAAAALLAWAGAASALEFHGYLRSGLGAATKKGGLECFKLQGAQGNGNFRLGNECETYGEAQFDQNLYEGKTDGVKFDYHLMFGYATTENGDFESLSDPGNHIALRQNYIDAKLPYLNGGSAWIGKRYYQRHDIHINDFFYWNNSGPGAGVEKIGLAGTLNTSIAYLRVNGNNNTNNPNNNASTVLDWRLAGIPGGVEVGVQYNQKDTRLPNSKNGFALLAEWTTNIPVINGNNKLFGMYGKDSAAMAGIRGPNNQLGCDFSQPGPCDQGWGIIDFLVIQPNPAFSAGFALGHYTFKNNFKWDFAGARPVFHVTDYFKIQGELGWNKVKAASQSDAGKLTKLTIAPTIVAGRGFWTRPELRLYYSYNKWNNKARDGVFGPGNGRIAGGTTGPFGTGTNGSVYGFQAEAWW